MRAHHVAISTTRFERLRAFYVETLGLPVVGTLPGERIVLLDAGGIILELIGETGPGQTEPAGFDRRGWQHLAWEVDDVDAAYANLVARGVAGHSPPEDFPPEDFPPEAPRVRIAFLRDPDGNLLELIRPLAAR